MQVKRSNTNRKGSALLVVLLIVMAITILSLSFLSRSDVELACGENMILRAQMDYLAESGLEHARGLILNPQEVTSEYWAGAAEQQLVAGSNDYYDVNVTKLGELNYQIASTAYREKDSERVGSSSLTANLRIDPDVAFWSAATVTLRSVMNITGDVYCNGVLKNWGTIDGDCFADSLVGNAISGRTKAKTDLQLSSPTINCSRLTANFLTYPIPSGIPFYTDQTLDDFEVYYKSTNFEIRKNVKINGCLAVQGNLTISGTGNIIIAKKNVPAIYVGGNLIIKEGASLDCNGLVYVNGQVELPTCSEFASVMGITGSLFTNGGIEYGEIVPDCVSINNGTIRGNCSPAAGPSGFGNALSFDGSDDFIDIGDAAVFRIQSKITVSAHIKVNSFDKADATVISKGDSTGWRLQRWGNTNFMKFVCAGIGAVEGSKNVNNGLWHHIVGVYDGSTLSLYVDGQLDNFVLAAGQMSTSSLPVYIGANAEQPNRYFNGLIDEVRVYNRGHTQTEVSLIDTLTTNLVGYWSMDCGTTTVKVAPTKAAIYHWPGGVKDGWSPAAGAFFKSIERQ